MAKPTPKPTNVTGAEGRTTDAATALQNKADPTDGAEAQKLRDKRQNQEKAEGD